jgi:hypothetical protein
MKATLSFNLPEDTEDFELASKARDLHCALWDIAQEVFRPARKHGYSNETLYKLVEDNENSEEIISMLEKMFYEILDKHNISL